MTYLFVAVAAVAALILDHTLTSRDAQYPIAQRYLESLVHIADGAQKIVFLPFEASAALSALGRPEGNVRRQGRSRMRKRIGSIVLAGCLLAAGCENAQEKARYVKEPLETVDASSLSSVNDAVREARTRLMDVRSEKLRTELSQEIDDESQRMLARIEENERRERERERDRAAAQDERARRRQAVADLQVSTRPSLLARGTHVLVLRNSKEFSVSFDLRCYTRGDTAQKTFFVDVPARGEKHIGFLQGWPGNFKPGERCEAYSGGERLWSLSIP
jgi:hypothetical protein